MLRLFYILPCPSPVTQATGNGSYSGTGYVVVPYLANTKLKVTFSNIQINTDHQLINGYLETTYDASESNIVNVQPIVDAVKDLGSYIGDLLKSNDTAAFIHAVDSIENATVEQLSNDSIKSIVNGKFDEIKDIAQNTPLNTQANQDSVTDKMNEIQQLVNNSSNTAQANNSNIAANKNCFYLIEGNKFFNGDTIFIPKSNKSYLVKGYQDTTHLFTASSVWSGFGNKTDSATYAYTPSTISQDISGSVLSTAFTRDSVYRDSTTQTDAIVKINDTLKCRIVVVDVNIKENKNQNFGFDNNYVLLYTEYSVYKNKNIPWKSLQTDDADKIYAATNPIRLSQKIDFYKADLDQFAYVQDSTVNITSHANDDYDEHFVYPKISNFKDSIQQVGVFTFNKIREKTACIIYVDEENDDIQVVQPNISTASDTTIVVASGKNKFLDTKADPRDSVITKIVNGDTLQYIVAGSDKICNTVAKSTNESAGDIPCSTDELKDSLNKIYYPAGIEFSNVVIASDRLAINYDKDRNDTLCADDITQIEYKTMLDGVWNYVVQHGNPYTYYFIMVKNASAYSPSTGYQVLDGIGYGLNKSKDEEKYSRVVLVALSTDQNFRTFTNTCGHELGHSAFDLHHP